MIDIAKPKSIYIDGIQRLPSLLNSIQVLIDSNKFLRFYLTGSSARKLKRGNANLLPGRLFSYQMGPLVASELGYKMDTKRALEFGTLPEIYLTPEESLNQNSSAATPYVLKLLNSYTATYLREEIKAEALVRNLESFSRFLQEIILYPGLFIDYSKLSKKSKISRHAIPRYFEILEDTMVGQRISAFPDCDIEDLIKHPKFYLFDNGVYNAFLQNHTASLDRIGVLAKQLVFTQILHSAWSFDQNAQLFTFRTRSGIEVDFILKLNGKIFAIEVKTSENISTDDCAALLEFQRRVPNCKDLFIFHMGHKEKVFGPVRVLPCQKGLKEIGL